MFCYYSRLTDIHRFLTFLCGKKTEKTNKQNKTKAKKHVKNLTISIKDQKTCLYEELINQQKSR